MKLNKTYKVGIRSTKTCRPHDNSFKWIPMFILFILLSSIVTAGLFDWFGNKEFSYVYEQETKKVPIYSFREKVIPAKYNSFNDTTVKQKVEQERYVSSWEVKIINITKTGVKYKGKEYTNSNIEDDKLVTWNVPMGNRNLEEFGKCRKYETEKILPNGKPVCEEKNI